MKISRAVSIVADFDFTILFRVVVRDVDRNIAAERGSRRRQPIVIESNCDGRILGGSDEFAVESVGAVNLEVIDAVLEIAKGPRVFQMAPGRNSVVAHLNLAGASAARRRQTVSRPFAHRTLIACVKADDEATAFCIEIAFDDKLVRQGTRAADAGFLTGMSGEVWGRGAFGRCPSASGVGSRGRILKLCPVDSFDDLALIGNGRQTAFRAVVGLEDGSKVAANGATPRADVWLSTRLPVL